MEQIERQMIQNLATMHSFALWMCMELCKIWQPNK